MQHEHKSELIKKVESAIDSIRPYLEADGGNITVDDITDDLVARVKLHGACSSCSMSTMTLQAGVAEAIRHAVPEIREVVAVNMPENAL
ncbi:MAG: NifU family protein [Bacteroidetes bacterium]|nr:NifU family protein [Bacteroidota bacterium]